MRCCIFLLIMDCTTDFYYMVYDVQIQYYGLYMNIFQKLKCLIGNVPMALLSPQNKKVDRCVCLYWLIDLFTYLLTHSFNISSSFFFNIHIPTSDCLAFIILDATAVTVLTLALGRVSYPCWQKWLLDFWLLSWTCLPPAGQFSALHNQRGKQLSTEQ